MNALGNQLKVVRMGGAAFRAAEHLDKAVVAVAAAAQSTRSAAERARITSALTPAVTALQLSRGDFAGAQKTTADLLRYSVDTLFAASRLAATPLRLAGAAIAMTGGDALKLGRGAIAGGLTAVNVQPLMFNTLVRLARSKTPEQVVKAFAAAPMEVALASGLHAAHDALTPFAHPIPKAMKELLQGHLDSAVLDRAQFIVSSGGFTVPEAVNALRSTMTGSRDISTFVVKDIIVFSDHPGLARASLRLWAYGVAHIELYEKLGVDGWTAQFVENPAGLEAMVKSRVDQVLRPAQAAAH